MCIVDAAWISGEGGRSIDRLVGRYGVGLSRRRPGQVGGALQGQARLMAALVFGWYSFFVVQSVNPRARWCAEQGRGEGMGWPTRRRVVGGATQTLTTRASHYTHMLCKQILTLPRARLG
jgi:hypothetical protein